MTLPQTKLRATRPLIAVLSLCAAVMPAFAETPAVPQAEQAYTETMQPPQASWGFVRGDLSTAVFDSLTGKRKGSVSTSQASDLAIDPAGKYYYVAESIWTKGIRGTRQDMITVYDTATLSVQSEIAIPGRLIIGGRKQNFIVSNDGKTGHVYNMDPASSVNVVDLVKRKFVRAIELPGCASLVPNPGVGFSALCSDGSLATVATGGAKPVITHSAPFFDPKNDPIYDNFTYDKVKGEVTYISFTGLIYQVKLGATPTISPPWSIQAAAGIRPGETRPLEVNWLPGGLVPMALHRQSGHIYVLMHMGEYWTQKQAGTEVWEADLVTHKIVKRVPLAIIPTNIEVTQTDAPMLFLSERKDAMLYIYDTKNYEQKYKIENGGADVIATIDPR